MKRGGFVQKLVNFRDQLCQSFGVRVVVFHFDADRNSVHPRTQVFSLPIIFTRLFP
jgi:hypothetical protein